MISIVTTTYNSASYIDEFIRRISDTLKGLGEAEYEIIIVDDGSDDNTSAIIKEFIDHDPRIVLFELSRNFGQHPAIMTGLRQCRGEYVFLIDSDLEEPPELLPEMLAILSGSGGRIDVVFGVQERRNGQISHTLGGKIFYKVFNALSDVKIPEDSLTVRLMTKRYVSALTQYKETSLALGGLFVLAGFNQAFLQVPRTFKGSSSYDLPRKIALALRFVVSFSSKPAIIMSLVGATSVALSLVYALSLLFLYFIFGNSVEGWTTLVIITILLNGIVLLCVGVCAAYLSLIFSEVKRRPLTIIKEVHHQSSTEGAAKSSPEVPREM